MRVLNSDAKHLHHSHPLVLAQMNCLGKNYTTAQSAQV